MVPVRAELEVLAVTEKLTNPVPVIELPSVTVIHELLLTAVHPHPDCVVTEKLPVPEAAPTERAGVESAKLQDDVLNVNGLDGVLVPVPPGPTALTRASLVVVVLRGHVGNVFDRLTCIKPVDAGVGLPRLFV
jgi:hypothetical protein